MGSPPQDAGLDVSVDLPSPDAGTPDTGPTDTGPTDTGPTDTGPMDTGPTDTGPTDTGPMDTGPTDSGPTDTGPMDSGPVDSGPTDTGPFECTSSADCVGRAEGPSCDPRSRRCVPCTAADDRCAVGQRCDDTLHQCVAGCSPTRACPAMQTCCDGGCVDLAADVTHCGACGTACAAQGASSACRMGTCAVTSCAEGLGDCDDRYANGCETDTRTAPAHCGACGRACPTPANAAPTCTTGACGFTCTTGFADCDGDATNGCEADTRVSASHCGACGVSCASGTCDRGTCLAPLGSMGNPATSCRAVRDATPGSTDGEKFILVNGAPVAVRCEQSTEGGGWTVVARVIDEVYTTPPPPIGVAGVGSTTAWRAHTWRSGESYYLSLDTFDAMTTGTSEVMLYSRDASGAVVSRVILSGVDYNATTNRMTITGACRNVVGSACGAAWGWRNSPPGFNMAGRSDYCNATYPDRIWNYHNEVGCASDWGLFAWPGYGSSVRARPGWIGRYETPAQETVILVR